MDTLATYELQGRVATITMDDGKANVLSPQMLAQLKGAFDQAESDRAVVVLTGREGMFSAGFDLTVLRAGGTGASGMVRSGFELAERVLSFPMPVVIACSGHAIAMGVFLLLSGDYRVGAAGAFKIVANEVALGLTMPMTAIEICRQRLAPAHFNRAVLLSELYVPDDGAVVAGFLDRVVPPTELHEVAKSTAEAFGTLDVDAHAASKLRARRQALQAIRAAIEADDAALRTRI